VRFISRKPEGGSGLPASFPATTNGTLGYASNGLATRGVVSLPAGLSSFRAFMRAVSSARGCNNSITGREAQPRETPRAFR
jgi:hypothetical protein